MAASECWIPTEQKATAQIHVAGTLGALLDYDSPVKKRLNARRSFTKRDDKPEKERKRLFLKGNNKRS